MSFVKSQDSMADMRQKAKVKRGPQRSFAEFAADVGVSIVSLRALAGRYPEQMPCGTKSGAASVYYDRRELVSWWRALPEAVRADACCQSKKANTA